MVKMVKMEIVIFPFLSTTLLRQLRQLRQLQNRFLVAAAAAAVFQV